MTIPHTHAWTVTELVLDHAPSVPAYASYCACGAPRPAGLELAAW